MRSFWVFLACLSLFLNACGGGGGSSSGSAGSSLVSITVGGSGKTASLKIEKNTLLAQAKLWLRDISRPTEVIAGISSNVSKITFTITASDVSITRDVSVAGQSPITETFSISNGAARHFHIDATDSPGETVYFGDDQRDLDGTAVTLDIPMKFVNLSGSIVDAVTKNPVAGVSVEVYQQAAGLKGPAMAKGTLVSTAATNAQGKYYLSIPAGSGYGLNFSKANYIIGSYDNIAVQAGVATALPPVAIIDTAHSGPGNISGAITNAKSGAGVAGLTIKLRAGVNVTSGSYVVDGSGNTVSAVTDSGGNYGFSSLAAGNYTAEAAKSGYKTVYFTMLSIGSVTTSGQNATVAKVIKNIAVLNNSSTAGISYWTGSLTNAYTMFKTILEADPDTRFVVTVITDVTPATLAGMDVLVLPDSAVPDAEVPALDAWFVAGKGLVLADSAVGLASYTGYVWSGGVGTSGQNTYWDYSSGSNDGKVILFSDPMTAGYTASDTIACTAGDAQLYADAAKLPADFISLTAKASDPTKIYVGYRNVPGKGRVVILGPYDGVVGTSSNANTLIRNAVYYATP